MELNLSGKTFFKKCSIGLLCIIGMKSASTFDSKYLYPTEPKLITVLNFGKVSLSHVSTYISLQTI